MQKKTRSFLGLDWSGLQYFLAAARAGSAANAARQLGIDQVTVSRHIKALEAGFGTRLFDRGPRGLALTPAGEDLLEMAERMEGVAIGAYSKIASQNAKVSGLLRVAAPEGFNTYFLPQHLSAFREAHPDLDVQIVSMSRLHSVSKRETDIAITVGQVLEGRAMTRRVGDFTLGMFGAKSYLDNHPPITSIADLHDHDIIGYVDDLVVMPDLHYLGEISPDLRPTVQSASLVTRMMLTVHGLGLSLVPHFMARTQDNLVPVLPDQILFTRSYWAVVHEDMRDLARVRLFLDFLVKTLRHNPLAEPMPAALNSPGATHTKR